jgi:8-oxo-dGTP pyrophosphatase MutT (NUDIX family)
MKEEDIFHLGVKAVIQNSSGKILLLGINPRKLKKGGGWSGEIYFDIPGGRIKRGDTVEKTLRTEIQEETGITDISSYTPFTMVLSNIRIPTDKEDVGLILSVYTCKVEIPNTITLSDEHRSYKWVTPSEASELLSFKYPKEFIEKLKRLKKI